MSPINAFLLQHNLRIATNPCVSPDFCLDWPALRDELLAGKPLKVIYAKSTFETAVGRWTLGENEQGDHAWRLEGAGAKPDVLADGVALPGGPTAFPATFANLLRLKNLIQEHDAKS